MASFGDGCYTGYMERIKRTGKVLDPSRWPDSGAEDLLYWITRPPEERVEFGRRLVVSSYRRVHGGRFPRMSRTGRIFEPEA